MIFNMSGYLPDAVTKDMVVNNYTTTEEGYVADARALKELYDYTTPALTYSGVINNVNLTVYTFGKICYLKMSTYSDAKISNFQLPNGIGADGSHLFTGKANHPQLGDIWYQPFLISEQGVVSARSQNNNSDIEVSWINATTMFLMK